MKNVSEESAKISHYIRCSFKKKVKGLTIEEFHLFLCLFANYNPQRGGKDFKKKAASYMIKDLNPSPL